MKRFKKLISCAAAVTLAATNLVGGSSFSASADDLIENYGPYTEDAFYIGTFMREQYYTDTAFEITFKYDTVGTPSKPVPDEQGNVDEYVGYNDTFEFLVFDTGWGGWNKTTVGPAGYDITANPDLAPDQNKEYTVTVPISVIESKLAEGTTPYGINLQTGLIGTSTVSIVSLELVSEGEYVQQPFTITGEWTKGIASTMEVSPAKAATVNANEYNIEVSAIDLSAWTNPTVQVTVEYASSSTSEPDEEGNSHEFAQAEIIVPTGEFDSGGNPEYEAVDPNYVPYQKGTTTYTTEIPVQTTKFIAAYTECTVKKIYVYDNTEGNVDSDYPGVNNQSSTQIAENMGLAWDLGDSFEASQDGNVGEKLWGNPKTTKALIQQVKAAGFNTIKIPISYMNMINSDNTIDTAYMARIQQVVHYAYDMGMYVVINIHNDGDPTTTGSWINIGQDPTTFLTTRDKFAAVWGNIANNFTDYDQRLVFEATNELLFYPNYTTSPDPAYTNINALNQAFVTAVRNAGGKNTDRVLIITGYNTNIDLTVKSTGTVGFVKPTDPSNLEQNRLMLDVHYMDPFDFVGVTETGGSDSLITWTVENENANVYGSKAYMEAQFEKISDFASSLDMPVFLGEYGPENKVKDTTSATDATANLAARANYDYWLNYYAATYGIVTAYWDNGVIGYAGSALFDRTNNTITVDGKIIVAFIIEGYEDGK